MGTTIFYHRGGGKSLGYPPNCIETLKWALRNGAKGLEYDVMAAEMQEDYDIVMIESGLVERKGLDINSLEWKNLEEIDAGNNKTGECDVAKLSEVLGLVDQSEVKQQIHIKGENPETVPALEEELDSLENITVTSFDFEVLERVKKFIPRVEIGWIVKPDSESGSEGTQDLTEKVTSNPGALSNYTEEELDRIREKTREKSIDTVILCGPKIKGEEQIEFFRQDGLKVGGWGVGSNLDVAERMVSIGLDRFTIDNPERLEIDKFV